MNILEITEITNKVMLENCENDADPIHLFSNGAICGFIPLRPYHGFWVVSENEATQTGKVFL